MSFSSRTMQAADWAKVAPEFKPSEFDYPDLMGYEFMLWLHKLRIKAGFALHISSDHRKSDHNSTVGGASKSAHMDVPCDAVDIHKLTSVSRFKLVRVAIELGCQRIGVYENGSVHLDRTESVRPSPVLWVKV